MNPQLLFLAAVLATSPVGLQQPTSAPPKPSSNTPDDRLATPAIPAKVTVDGCVASGAEIPNRKLDLGEKTGLDKHFVLVKGAVVKGKSPVVAPAGGPGGGSSALAPMFELHGLTDEQLALHVGHRVRIEGHFTNVDGAAPTGRDDDAIRLEVATIRQVPGDCSVPRS